MSDVLFGFNKFDLKTDAEIKLAKVSGILLTYPNLKVQVEGYTDNVGSAAIQPAALRKAGHGGAVLPDLSGRAAGGDIGQGYGAADPVADNSTSAGRAKNRRVELVVSGAGDWRAGAGADSGKFAAGASGNGADYDATAAPTRRTPQPQPQNPTGVSQGPPQ